MSRVCQVTGKGTEESHAPHFPAKSTLS